MDPQQQERLICLLRAPAKSTTLLLALTYFLLWTSSTAKKQIAKCVVSAGHVFCFVQQKKYIKLNKSRAEADAGTDQLARDAPNARDVCAIYRCSRPFLVFLSFMSILKHGEVG
jgi:hypothetical protein